MKDIKDIKIKRGQSTKDLLKDLGTTGFQASNVFQASEMIRKMKEDDCKIFLSFTANMMASGLRGSLTQLVKEGYVDAVITTGGSIDHDIIKSYKKYWLGDFAQDDINLHKRQINRIGNILVPNNRYVFLEKKMRGIYKGIYKKDRVFTPSQLNRKIGESLPNGSFLSVCVEKGVPVFCPGMIDSAVGLHLFFFRQDHQDFIMNTAEDMNLLIDRVYDAKKTAGIILGGGISKHHLIGANLLRGGLDYAVYISTAIESDGSLSGAAPREAKSWGKIKEKGGSVSVHSDASIALPLIISALI